jgi:hypothetical protein
MTNVLIYELGSNTLGYLQNIFNLAVVILTFGCAGALIVFLYGDR